MNPVCLNRTLQISWLIFLASLLGNINPALAQNNIVPDDTLGEESSVVNVRDETSDKIDGGATRGSNLFHSFQEFNVGEGRGVYFSNSDGINNVFSRVTGSNASNILGTLGVDGAANLYLINPNGIIFGANSSLDVQGSFTATTAHGVRFGEQGTFDALNPQAPQLLTVNPSAYFFNHLEDNGINSIQSEGKLEVQQGKNLTFLGGDIELSGATVSTPESERSGLFASGGLIELGSVKDSGEIEISELGNLIFPDDLTRGNISIDGISSISNDISSGEAQENAGDIKLTASSLNLTNGGSINSFAREGNSGSIEIVASDSIIIEGESSGDFSFPSSISSWVFEGEGNAGDIKLTTSSLSLTNGGQINSSAREGNSGSIEIVASDSIIIDGESSGDFSFPSSISSDVFEGEGNAGDIKLTTSSLNLTNGGRIDSFARDGGNSGSIEIVATDSISLSRSRILSSNIDIQASNITLNGTDINGTGTINLTATEDITLDEIITNDVGIIKSSISNSVEQKEIEDNNLINITSENLVLTKNGTKIFNLVDGIPQSKYINFNIADKIIVDDLEFTKVEDVLEQFNNTIFIDDLKVGVESSSNIIPDSSLGTENSIVERGANRENISGGAIRNFNLFHSFQEFNVGKKRETYFVNPDDITNIFARVTGNNISEIKGTLGVLGNANLFIMNPNGILFNVNSRLDVNSSFFVTTADNIIFDDNIEFSATNPNQSSLLGFDNPMGFKFRNNPGDLDIISNFNINLSVPIGETLALLGGDIKLNSVSMGATGINLRLVSAATDDFIGLVQRNNQFDLDYRELTQGKNIEINNSPIDAYSYDFDNNGETETNISNIEIYGRNIIMDSSGIIFYLSQDVLEVVINLNALELIQIDSSEIILGLEQRVLDGTLINQPKENVGKIKITTGSLKLTNGGYISSSTTGENSGSIEIVTTDSIVIDGDSSSISRVAILENENSNLNGEIISLDRLKEIINGRTNNTNSQEDNNISIEQNNNSKILSMNKVNTSNIMIKTKSLKILDGAIILNLSHINSNEDSSILILANDSIIIDGKSSNGDPSRIFSSSSPKSNKDVANIMIITNLLSLSDEAVLSTESIEGRHAGNILVNADILTLDNNARISSSSDSSFRAGNITLNITDSLKIEDSLISNFANQSQAGNIDIHAEKIELRGNSDISTRVNIGSGRGGNITLKADSVIAFDDSDIIASAKDGRGGNITIDTPAFFGENFTVTSLRSKTQNLVDNNRVDINATGAVFGFVSLPDVSFIQNSLTEISNNAIDTDKLVANSCVVPNREQKGTFIITGKGGLATTPDDESIAPYSTGEVQTIESDRNSNWQPGDPIIEPQGVYRLSNGKLILSRECSRS